MKKSNGLLWAERVGLPHPYITLCITEAEYHRACRHFALPKEQWGPWVNAGSSATTHLLQRGHDIASVVCLGPHEDVEPIMLAGLLVHEAVHIVEQLFRHMDEKTPGEETRAYLTQSISQQLMWMYVERTKR